MGKKFQGFLVDNFNYDHGIHALIKFKKKQVDIFVFHTLPLKEVQKFNVTDS